MVAHARPRDHHCVGTVTCTTKSGAEAHTYTNSRCTEACRQPRHYHHKLSQGSSGRQETDRRSKHHYPCCDFSLQPRQDDQHHPGEARQSCQPARQPAPGRDFSLFSQLSDCQSVIAQVPMSSAFALPSPWLPAGIAAVMTAVTIVPLSLSV